MNKLKTKSVLSESSSQVAREPDAPGSYSALEWAQPLLDALSDSVFIVDASGLISFANLQAAALFGWERSDLIGQSIDLLIPPALIQTHSHHRENFMQNPVQRPMGIGRDLLGYRKDASVFPVEVRLSPFDTDASQQVFCLVTDISNRLASKFHLQTITNRFQALFKAFPLPAYIWQHQADDFILIEYNEADQGYSASAVQKFLGRSLSAMYPEGGQEVEDIQRCYREKFSFKREYHNYRVRSTGVLKDQMVTFVFGEPDLVMVIVEDQTDRRASLGALKKLSSAVEQTADAIFITDRDGIIEYVNPGFETITGYPRAEVVGKTPRVLKSGQMSAEYYQQLWETVLAGQPFRAQTTNRRRDGTLFIAEQTITSMQDDQGQITHFVSVLKDMTERLLLQEQQTEHRLAGIIQNRLFPNQPPQIAGYDIDGAIFPAEATSGDYFDYLAMPDGSTGIVVADVSGHGMGSALLMAETRAYLRSVIKFMTEPWTVLHELNVQLMPDLVQDSNFITMFLACLNPGSHTLAYANAGNWPAYILDRQGRLIHELRTHGTPLGVMPDLTLPSTGPVYLAPGSLTVFLTDGIPEANDVAFQDFGVCRMLSIIRRHRSAPASEIVDRVREAVRHFMDSTRQADDQTIIICKRVS